MTVFAIVQSWYILGTTTICIRQIHCNSHSHKEKQNDPNWLSGIYLVCSVSESIFLSLILFDLTSIIFICSTDRTCISFKKLHSVDSVFIFLGVSSFQSFRPAKFMNGFLKFVLVNGSEYLLRLADLVLRLCLVTYLVNRHCIKSG